jgi:hypothetical protein
MAEQTLWRSESIGRLIFPGGTLLVLLTLTTITGNDPRMGRWLRDWVVLPPSLKRGGAVASDTHRINRPHENVGLSNRIKREGSHWRWQIFWNSTVILQGVAATRAKAVASARGLQLFIRAPRLADQQEHATDLRPGRGK